MEAHRIAWTTGTQSINRSDVYAAVGGTDLGIIWDDGGNGVLSIWGDTYADSVPGLGTAKGLDWRYNVVARSVNRDYQTRGLVTYWWNTDKPNHARQVINKDLFGTEHTIIPTSGICVNRRNYVSYMAVDHFGAPGEWETQYAGFAWSDDYGQNWTKDTKARYNNTADHLQNWQMVAFARPDGYGGAGYDGYVYLYGTPNGRFGGAKVARVPENSILDLTKHRQWNGTAWVNDQSQAINVIPGPVSELSIGYHVASKQWLAAYYHSTLNAIVVLTGPTVMGPWSSPNIVATAADYPGLYGFYFHPWSMWWDQNPCASMSQWPPYNTELMQLTGVPGIGTVPVSASKLTSAQGYANNINAVSNDNWCGSNNIFPVQCSDGRRLWISGMAYAGSLTTSTHYRPINYQTVMNTVLEERDLTFAAYNPTFTDSVGRKHFFDSRQIPGIGSTSPVRLDPIGGVSLGDHLYLSMAWSGTNYTYPYLFDAGSSIDGSGIFLVQIPLNALSSGICSISKSVLMPSTPVLGAGNLNFGSGFYVFDEQYVYIAGRSSVGSDRWHIYMARVERSVFESVTYVPQGMEYFSFANNTPSWDPDVSSATPILTYMGPNVDIRLDVDGFFHYLINVLGHVYLLKQRSIARDMSEISPFALSLMTIPADAGSNQFKSFCVYDVGWASLTSGNRLGVYTVTQTNQSYDQVTPSFSRPHFFEYNELTGVAASPLYVPPP